VHPKPAPDDPRKPDSPTDLTTRSKRYVGRKVIREFMDDQCLDLAAALTYYAVLATFPALLALVSLLGLVGQAEESVDTALEVLGPLLSPQTIDALEPSLRSLAASDTAGTALILGVVGAIWSASGYVGAFGRAMNKVYEIREGRPFWKLRPVMLVITLGAVLLSALVLLMLVVSGPVAESVGGVVGLSDTSVQVWNIAKWPVLAVLVMLVVAILYYATPNVQQPRFRWLSVGAVVAIVAWVLASVGFAFYVANFSSYDRTYGSIGAVIVSLLWLWITNLALLLGAEIDAELERGRELQAGLPAEREIQLPPRDTRNIEKADRKEREDVDLGRRIRRQHADRGGHDE
jgi:membrane protein